MLNVPENLLQETIAHLQAHLPHEGVALWSGRGDDVQAWTPLRNAAREPHKRYAVDPREWIAVLHQVDLRGETPLALVHSHPTAAAVPSSYDRAHWHYPDLWCVIVSFAASTPEWQAYRIDSCEKTYLT